MMLISQTVDPDEWRDFGGTGNSSMLPFPNGVWIDAAGHLKRMERRTTDGIAGNNTASHQRWIQSSGLRTISLKKLNSTIQANRALGLPPTAQMENLAGITHIEYVLVDREAHDVLLAGPAGTQANLRGALNLEDLCLLVRLTSDHTAPLGCSLDPHDQGLAAAQQFLRLPGTTARLGRSPQAVAEQLKRYVGPHEVHIFGIDPKSTTALALVDADELMKRYGLGLSKGASPIKTYFDQLDRNKNVQPQSVIRWWFTYNNEPLTVSTEGDLFQMPKQAAATMSEQQWISATGQRAPTGAVDSAADGFAKDFTQRYLELSASEPAFARLEGIFELGLALQVAIESSHQTSLSEWFPALHEEARYISFHDRAPESVEGVTACSRLHNGTVVAVVSGGVTLDSSALVHQSFARSRSYISRPKQLRARDTAAGSWWWD